MVHVALRAGSKGLRQVGLSRWVGEVGRTETYLSSHVREFTQVQAGTCVIHGGNPRVLSFTITKVLLTQRVTDRYKKMQP